ncbi:hypothetical protein BDB01DRAFT_729058 [Pilobolus umbonatus]|nr:hypothetical protein BDB01DRAFT_729058 [Pilobolus umbonatus]
MQRTSSPSHPLLLDDESDLSVNQATVTWEQLRKEARSLENEIESHLGSFSKLGQTSVDNTGQEAEVEQLLKKFQRVINQMADYIDRPSPVPTNPSMIHLLGRHKDILYDYNKEFRMIKANLKATRDKANLLNQVQDEIRSSHIGNRDSPDYYLTERNRVESSHRMTDMILEQAYTARQDVSRQGSIMRGVNQRVGGVINQIPGINNIITRIHKRRKRDTLIMAGVISSCIILIIIYWLRT